MKKKNLLMAVLALSIMLVSMLGLGVSAKAADNPYNYSSEPTRAIYYVVPTMRGNDVKWVQAALNAYGGYGLDVDGSFGPACKEATRKFQASRGLEQDGSFGPATRANMVSWLRDNGYTSSSQKPSEVIISPSGTTVKYDNPYSYSSEPTRAIYYTIPTMKGNDVKWVQAALNKFGNYGLSIDGSFGPACKEATKKFQAARGLSQDGSFGPATRANMVSWLNGSPAPNPAPEPASDKYNLCWPLPSGNRNITSSLGNRTAPVSGASVNHKGIDIAASNGTQVYATYNGVVTGVGSTGARGNYVVIYHGDIGLTSVYQHLSSSNVSYGQNVNKGDLIGYSGSTGNVSGPHLHFELVKTSSQSQSNVDCAWASGAMLIDGHYNNQLINYSYKN